MTTDRRNGGGLPVHQSDGRGARSRSPSIWTRWNQATTLVAGLYSNNNGHPGSRLASGSLSNPTGGAWNAVSVGSSVVKAGTMYWVAILGKGGTLYFRDRSNGPCMAENSVQTTLTSLPSKWSDGARWNTCPASVYVNGLLSGSGANSSAPSNTALPVMSGSAAQDQTAASFERVVERQPARRTRTSGRIATVRRRQLRPDQRGDVQ